MAMNVGTMGHVQTAHPTGIASWLTTIDHKRIGTLYGLTAFGFFLLGGIEALLIRTQLFYPNLKVLSPEVYNQMFTMHGTTMVFLVIMPMSAGFFNWMIPLMIGARDVAFPRLNAFSFWVFVAGGLILNISFLFGAGPDQGWFGYAPLTSKLYGPELRVDFWALGLQVLGISSLAAGFNFIVTIINMRAPGLSMMRLPVFVWMAFIVNWLLVLAMPVIAVALVFLIFDRNFGTNFYIVGKGGDPILWQHLFWVFGHPEVYILILPAMGIVSEVLPVFSRKPLFGYAFVVYSGVAIAFLGFGVWAHHMFAVGMGPIADSAFAISTMLIAVPTGVKIFNWMGTLWGGSIIYKTANLFAIGFIAQFIIGGLSGVMHASPPADLQQTDTYFIVAHFHYVLFGGSMFGLAAGWYYWFPKWTGRLMNEGLGKLHFWLMFAGFNLTFFPMHFVGLNGQPRRTYTYPSGYGWDLMNQLETIGAYVIAISVLVFIYNFAKSRKSGEIAGPNPFDGATLEWAIPSPPPEYNFAEIPTVHGRDPLWDDRHHGGSKPNTALLDANIHPGHDVHVHMPNPSWWPLLAGLGMFLFGFGVILGFPDFSAGEIRGFPLMAVGLITFIGSIYNWAFEPAS